MCKFNAKRQRLNAMLKMNPEVYFDQPVNTERPIKEMGNQIQKAKK